MKKKLFAVLAISMFILASFAGLSVTGIKVGKNREIKGLKNTMSSGDGNTEYWALLVAVGVYADSPEENRPSMLKAIDDLYDVLLESPNWSADHIKVIKGEDATVLNIILGLRWLDMMDDKDDISLVYITTHGFPLSKDIQPLDEEDGYDEALMTYWGFVYPLAFIWDDELNLLLGRLDSKGLCLIVDSCFSGGFNDPPFWNRNGKNILPASKEDKKTSLSDWMKGFAEDVSGKGRVVVMSCQEDEVSYSGVFSPFLIDALRGFADSNVNGVVSAEEIFGYVKNRVPKELQHPTIYDGYPGELPLIDTTDFTVFNGDFSYIVYRGGHNTRSEGFQDIGEERFLHDMNRDRPTENSIVCGFITDDMTEEPIDDANVNLEWTDDQGNYDWNHTYANSSGFYKMNVAAGEIRLNVYADGYFNENTEWYHIDEYETIWINISMTPLPPENSIVRGYITDVLTEEAIEDAQISLRWQNVQGQYYYNHTYSNSTGFYSLNVAAGEIRENIYAEGYLNVYGSYFLIDEYETLWLNVSMTPFPPENSIVCGYITDDMTDEPIDDADVNLEWTDGQGNYDWNHTHANSSGFYKMNVATGEVYLSIWADGYCYEETYRNDAEENETLWINVSLSREIIEVDISKPLKAIYKNNIRLIPFFRTAIIGEIEIEAYVHDSWFMPMDAEKVEFYVDDDIKATITSEPYIWMWVEKTPFRFRHTIKVIAYDNEGNSVSDEITVWKFF